MSNRRGQATRTVARFGFFESPSDFLNRFFMLEVTRTYRDSTKAEWLEGQRDSARVDRLLLVGLHAAIGRQINRSTGGIDWMQEQVLPDFLMNETTFGILRCGSSGNNS